MKQFSAYFILFFAPHVSAAQNFSNPLFIPPSLSGTSFTLSYFDTSHQFYPGIITASYGINGSFLGPTLVFNKGDTVNISVINNLPETTTCHWHGLHVPAVYDGGPHHVIAQATTWNVQYEVKNSAATYWYHPHIHMNTQSQITKGLAGIIIVKDSAEAQLALPRTYGTDDFPLVIQDRKFNGLGQMVNEALGDSMLVNGTPHPFLGLPQQVVRLRLLNGSNARVYNIGFSDNRMFHVIAGDASLLQQPVQLNRLMLSNGERAEILLDLSGDSIGDSLVLMSYASEMDTDVPGNIIGGMGGFGPLEGADFGIMQINVLPQTANPVLAIPSSLIALNPWSPANADRTRNRSVSGMGTVGGLGMFMMDGVMFDMNVINDTMLLGDLEVWNVYSTSNIAHPIHLHGFSFYIVTRDGFPPPAYEEGLKDVFILNPNETVTIITLFENFANDTMPYMYHCHNLAHEDMGMMLQFIVANGTSGITGNTMDEEFVVFPNPAGQHLVISFNHESGILREIEICDAMGKKHFSYVNFTNRQLPSPFMIDVSSLHDGFYFIKATGKEITLQQKFIKQ